MSSAVRQAFEQLFKTKADAKGILKVSRGAQFGNSGGVALFMLVVLLLIGVGVSLVNGLVFIACVLAGLSVLLIGYILDIQGFEIDLKSKRIRNYHSFLGARTGAWLHLEGFKVVKVYQENLVEGRAMQSGYSYRRQYDTHHYYTLVLLNPESGKIIELYEGTSYVRTMAYAKKLADLAGLTFIDKLGMREAEYC